MTVTQIYELVNGITSEILGESAILNEDLSNVVDLGTSLFNANAVDNYVRKLVDRIGKVVFVNRAYSGNVPSVLRDGWEYGSVIEKISAELPDATENESWELQNGASYDPNIFYKPSVEVKFFNSKTTFEIPMSFTERQIKESFTNATQLNAFLSMLYNAVENSMTIKIDGLIARVINTLIAETIYDDYGVNDLGATSGVKAINLLYLFNERFNKSLTAEDSITDPDFIRFASYTMGVYAKRLTRMSTLFNVNGKERFTSADRMSLVLLADFKAGADAYLQSDTFHNEFTALPNAESVPYWQGSGASFDFDDITAINVSTANSHTVSATGILGVMFDRDACGVYNEDRRVTTNYNPKAEFYSNWYKFDCSYFCDLSENAIVFFVADNQNA